MSWALCVDCYDDDHTGVFGSLFIHRWRGDPRVFDCVNRVSHSEDGIALSRVTPHVQDLTIVSYEIIGFSLSFCQHLAGLEEENDGTKSFVCHHLHLLHLATSDGICRIPSIHYQNPTHSINAIELIQDNTCIGIVPDLHVASPGSICAQSSHPISSCLIHQIHENVTITSSLRRTIFCSNFF
jgi:hypothetical protein